jgi:hypothetical protein
LGNAVFDSFLCQFSHGFSFWLHYFHSPEHTASVCSTLSPRIRAPGEGTADLAPHLFSKWSCNNRGAYVCPLFILFR